MSKRFLVPINMSGLEIREVSAEHIAGNPATPVEGQFWYDSVSGRIKFRNAVGNQALIVTGTDIPEGTVPLSALNTDPLARANHTGTQPASTISDFDAQVRTSRLDQMAAPTADVAFNGRKITGLGAPTLEGDAATKAYVDNLGVSFPMLAPSGTAAAPSYSFSGDEGTGIFRVGAAQVGISANGTARLIIGSTTIDSNLPIVLSADPIAPDHAARKAYVDAQRDTRLALSGGTLTGPLTLAGAPTEELHAVTKQYVDNVSSGAAGAAVAKAGDTMSGYLTLHADPIEDMHAANKRYVDSAITGLKWKEPVRAATVGNITLSGAQTIDGVSVVAGNRVLVKAQSTLSENGIYIVAAGAWSRAEDANIAEELVSSVVMVTEGATLANTKWVNNNPTITLGVSDITYVQFSGTADPTYGNGLDFIGNNVTVKAHTGISVSASGVAIDTAVVARKFSVNVGTGAATSIAVTHDLGTRDVQVQVYDAATYETVECGVARNSTSQVTLTFAVAPAFNSLRVVIIG